MKLVICLKYTPWHIRYGIFVSFLHFGKFANMGNFFYLGGFCGLKFLLIIFITKNTGCNFCTLNIFWKLDHHENYGIYGMV